MAKKLPRPSNQNRKTYIKVESWQWQTPQKFTWKHGLFLAILLAVALLFAFGFLIIAGVVLIVGIIINIALFLLKKLT